jgi:tetratricopeptide (TPR) repeat protein
MYADFLDSMGRFEEGLRQHQRALELDPLALIDNSNLGDAYYLARQYDKAIAQYKKTLEIDSHFASAHFGLVGAYQRKGMNSEAAAELQQGLKAAGDEESAAALARTYSAAGYKGMLKAWLARLEGQSSHSYVEPATIASFYAALGEPDRAFVFRERAYEARDRELVALRVDPGWDNLRSDPRFSGLLRRVGLP